MPFTFRLEVENFISNDCNKFYSNRIIPKIVFNTFIAKKLKQRMAKRMPMYGEITHKKIDIFARFVLFFFTWRHFHLPFRILGEFFLRFDASFIFNFPKITFLIQNALVQQPIFQENLFCAWKLCFSSRNFWCRHFKSIQFENEFIIISNASMVAAETKYCKWNAFRLFYFLQ